MEYLTKRNNFRKPHINAQHGTDINSIRISGNICEGLNGTYSGIAEIDLTECLANLSGNSVEIVIFTNYGVFTKYFFLDSKLLNESLTPPPPLNCLGPDGSIINNNESKLYYYPSPTDNSCSAELLENRTCNNGVLNGSAGGISAIDCYSKEDFVTLWDVQNEIETIKDYTCDNEGCRHIWDEIYLYYNKIVILPLQPDGIYDFNVYWGDGTYGHVSSYNDTNATHIYSDGGNYIIRIEGHIEEFSFNPLYQLKISSSYSLFFEYPLLDGYQEMASNNFLGILKWGNVKLSNNGFVFANTIKLKNFSMSYDNFNLGNITNLSGMFYQSGFDQDISDWDVSNVTDMSSMFHYADSFNQFLNNWDVSNVTDMSGMFHSADSFNQPLNNWDVSNVTDMTYMFYDADSFNQSLNSWNVSSVKNMRGMFSSAKTLNQPLNDWNVSRVTDMSYMFEDAYLFNQPLNDWDVSNVTDMSYMFSRAESFNQPLNSWNVSSVVAMGWMFNNAYSFNQPLNDWDVSSVTDMSSMFDSAYSFNQPLNDWDVSNVTDMSYMFSFADSFNQNLNSWCVFNIKSRPSYFASELTAGNEPIWGTCP